MSMCVCMCETWYVSVGQVIEYVYICEYVHSCPNEREKELPVHVYACVSMCVYWYVWVFRSILLPPNHCAY